MKYDDLDLLELFYEEPQNLYSEYTGDYIVKRHIDEFTLILWIGSYENTCDIFLKYMDKDLLAISWKNVKKLKKVGNNLRVIRQDNQYLEINFDSLFSIDYSSEDYDEADV